MNFNKFGQVEISEKDLIDLLYSKDKVQLENIYLDTPEKAEQFNKANSINYTSLSKLKIIPKIDLSLEQFDEQNQKNWFIPEDYQQLDIYQLLIDKCKSDAEKERVCQELELFKKHSMIDLLKYLKFLVETMRKNKIVWGVGRGSSVSSYCLYLLGVHRVNSIKYNLDINEFLK